MGTGEVKVATVESVDSLDNMATLPLQTGPRSEDRHAKEAESKAKKKESKQQANDAKTDQPRR